MRTTMLNHVVVAAAAAVVTPWAAASVHLMQIEQAIGGVDGDTGIQAIQLRMRSNFQNQLQQAKLWAHDAAGLNPVLLIDFTTPVASAVVGARVLVASPSFSASTSPAAVPDYVLTNPIPALYLAAGSIT
ncbi:MAG: hypothetical protein ACYS5V_12520, partial [Planctomycetota bacterium]